MILYIVQGGQIETLANVNEIKERRTEARTIIMPYLVGNDNHEGEIELNLAKVVLLPESGR